MTGLGKRAPGARPPAAPRNGGGPQAGFTVTELLVVIGIVAILAAIAVPNYTDYVNRGRRSDAMSILQRLANEQEQFYFDNNAYTTSMAALNYNTTVSPEGYYDLSIPSANVTLFVLRATPVAGSSQVGEGRFEIRSTGQKLWDPGEDGVYECTWDDAGRSGHGC